MTIRTVLLVAVGCVPASCFAQVGYDFNSLNLLVAQADVIVRGTVTDVVRGPVQNNGVTCVVTLDVTESLKGEENHRLRFVAWQHEQGRTLEQWRDAKSVVLWFLNRRPATKPKDEPSAPTAAEQIASHGTDLFLAGLGSQKIALGPRVKDDWAPPPPNFTTELQLLEKPDEILKITHELIAEGRDGGAVRVHAIDVPRCIPGRLGRSGDANRFSVSVDRHLEALARRLIATPVEVVPKADELRWKPKTDEDRRALEAGRRFAANQLRAEGAKALAYFKSDGNIAALKPLLQDEARRVEEPQPGSPGRLRRVYFVREAAFNVLRQWGVDVKPMPMLRDEPPPD
jgi:hypothetical protein